MHTIFQLENQNGRYDLEDIAIDGKIILEWILEQLRGKMRTAFIWFRMGTNGGMS
jgi:hypothetical protein